MASQTRESAMAKSSGGESTAGARRQDESPATSACERRRESIAAAEPARANSHCMSKSGVDSEVDSPEECTDRHLASSSPRLSRTLRLELETCQHSKLIPAITVILKLKSKSKSKNVVVLKPRHKIHFNPDFQQTKSGKFITKIRKFFCFHCVRAASNCSV